MATSGVRKGKARFGDDVRERARKFFEEQKKGKTDKGVKPVTKATAPKPTAKKAAAKAAAKPTSPQQKATDSAKRMQTERSRSNARMSERTSREPSRPMGTSRKAASQMGPRTTFPRNVGTADSKAAAARKEMMDKQGPLGDLMDKMSGARKSGVRSSVSRMKKGGMAKKGCKK